MSKSYTSYYAVSPPVEPWPALMMHHVGTTDDGQTVYHVLDPIEDATEHIYNCWQCYDSRELLFGDYPEMEESTSEIADGEEVERSRLTPHEWC